MMCLWASITCRAELRSIRWKPTKREAVSAPSRIWMSSQKETMNSRLAMISVAQRRLRHVLLVLGVRAGMQSSRRCRSRVALALVDVDLLGALGLISVGLLGSRAEHDLDLVDEAPLQ